MRQYKFEYISTEGDSGRVIYDNRMDDSDTLGNIDEALNEFKSFMLARRFNTLSIINGLQYIHWHTYEEPDYDNEYLVTIKGKDYITTAEFKDNEWSIPRDQIEAWAETFMGYGRDI